MGTKIIKYLHNPELDYSQVESLNLKKIELPPPFNPKIDLGSFFLNPGPLVDNRVYLPIPPDSAFPMFREKFDLASANIIQCL